MIRLAPLLAEKPWGRTSLPARLEAPGGKRICEIWFPAPEGTELPLLVKYLFTSGKLSIQGHGLREPHLADGVDVAKAGPVPSSRRTSIDPSRSAALLETSHFTLAQVVDGDKAPLSE